MCASRWMRKVWAMACFRRTDLPGGNHQLVAPPATPRSWVNARADNDAAVLTPASSERAAGAPMSEFLSSIKPTTPPQRPR